MKEKQIFELLRFYYLATSLKTKIRTAWIYWDVQSDRLESIAEHIYGTCILAISIHSQLKEDIDLDKVIKMLVLHELEEVKLGDFTDFDKGNPKHTVDPSLAIKEVLGDLLKAEEYELLISEFNERKTKEARFSYICDKLELDLQAKRYFDEGQLNMNNVSPLVMNSSAVQAILKNGVDNALDVFIEYDRPKYIGTNYEQVVDYAKTKSFINKQ
jgi:putative hydrolases of HD superfamily